MCLKTVLVAFLKRRPQSSQLCWVKARVDSGRYWVVPRPRVPRAARQVLLLQNTRKGDLRPGLLPTFRCIVLVAGFGIFNFFKS